MPEWHHQKQNHYNCKSFLVNQKFFISNFMRPISCLYCIFIFWIIIKYNRTPKNIGYWSIYNSFSIFETGFNGMSLYTDWWTNRKLPRGLKSLISQILVSIVSHYIDNAYTILTKEFFSFDTGTISQRCSFRGFPGYFSQFF